MFAAEEAPAEAGASLPGPWQGGSGGADAALQPESAPEVPEFLTGFGLVLRRLLQALGERLVNAVLVYRRREHKRIHRPHAAQAERDDQTKNADRFQRQINSLWGKMKRAEERLRQSGCHRWNAQHGGLRKEQKLADFIVKSKRK